MEECDSDNDDKDHRNYVSKEEKLKRIEETLQTLENGASELYKSTGSSSVWKKFMLIRNVETKKRIEFTQCMECKALLTFKENSGNSHLHRHKCRIDERAPDAGTKYRILVPETAGQVQHFIIRNIMEYCANEFLTWEKICQSPPFVDFAQSFVSLAQKHGNVCLKDLFPDSNAMNRAISKFKEEKNREIHQNFRRALNNDWCSASLCVKNFKCSTGTEKNLLIMRLQYYVNDFSALKNKAIFTLPFDPRNAEFFLRNLVNQFKQFGGDENDLHRMKIVTPNDTIFLKTLNFPFSRRKCMVNAITDILDEAFKTCESDELSNFLVSCRKIVKYVNGSDKYDFVLQADDVSWKEKVVMMESINKHYDEMVAISNNDDNFSFHFNKRKSEGFVALLSPFVEAVDDLSGTSYTTANKIFVWWAVLNEHFKSMDDYTSDLKELLVNASECFKSAFPVTMEDKMNSFLDPRFKQLLMLTESERSEVVNEVRNLLEEIEDNTVQVEATTSTGMSKPKKSRIENFESQKQKDKTESRSRVSNKEKPKSRLSKYEAHNTKVEETDEVSIYLKLPLLNSSHFEFEFDIIKKFWQSKQKILPKLYKLAITRLHVPAFCGSVGRNVIILKEDLNVNFINDLLMVTENLKVSNVLPATGSKTFRYICGIVGNDLKGITGIAQFVYGIST